MEFISPAVGLTVALGAATAVPGVLHLLGFTKAGIAAGSLAARMMSASAIANGGRVAAGSLVAVAQSLGMAGLPTSVWAALVAIGTVTGTFIGAAIKAALL